LLYFVQKKVVGVFVSFVRFKDCLKNASVSYKNGYAEAFLM
jgi:hypothetical protein